MRNTIVWISAITVMAGTCQASWAAPQTSGHHAPTRLANSQLPSDQLGADQNTTSEDILQQQFELTEPPEVTGSSMSFELGDQAKRSLAKVVGGLALVLALFVMVTWVARRRTRASPQSLPSQVLRVIGRTPLNQNQQLQLIRLGSKLVLIASSQNRAEPLSEITDADEVQQIEELCHQRGADTVSAVYRTFVGRRRAAAQSSLRRDDRRARQSHDAGTVFEA